MIGIRFPVRRSCSRIRRVVSSPSIGILNVHQDQVESRRREGHQSLQAVTRHHAVVAQPLKHTYRHPLVDGVVVHHQDAGSRGAAWEPRKRFRPDSGAAAIVSPAS